MITFLDTFSHLYLIAFFTLTKRTAFSVTLTCLVYYSNSNSPCCSSSLICILKRLLFNLINLIIKNVHLIISIKMMIEACSSLVIIRECSFTILCYTFCSLTLRPLYFNVKVLRLWLFIT